MKLGKRLLSLVVAVSMVVAMPLTVHAETTEGNSGEFSATVDHVKNATWTLNAQNSKSESVAVYVEIYDGVDLQYSQNYVIFNVASNPSVEFSCDSNWHDCQDFSLYETGEYTAKFYFLDEDNMFGESNKIKDEGIEVINQFSYTRPTQRVADVTNIRMDHGIVTWSPVEHAESYFVRLQRKVGEDFQIVGSAYDSFVGEPADCKVDLTEFINGPSECFVEVLALSDDIGTYANGTFAQSEIYGTEDSAGTGDQTGGQTGDQTGDQTGGQTGDGTDSELKVTIHHTKNANWEVNIENYEGYYWYVEMYNETTNRDYFGTCLNKVSDYSMPVLQSWDSAVNESGTYRYNCCFIKDDGTYNPATESESDFIYRMRNNTEKFSDTFEYSKPGKQLEDVENITCEDGVFKWDAVDNAETYEIMLYRETESGCEWVAGNGQWYMCEYDYSRDMSESGYYFIEIKANSKDISTWANGNKIKSEVFDTRSVSDKVEANLETLLQDETKSTEEIVKELKKEETVGPVKDFALAMQTEEAVLNTIKELETQYMQEQGVSTNDMVNTDTDTGLTEADQEKIEVVGMKLTNPTATLNIQKPKEENIIKNLDGNYANTIQFSIDAGIGSEELDIPVTITMPIPESITNLDKFVIWHYSDTFKPEKLRLKFNKEVRTVTFTVTHFSEFVFAEEVKTVSPSVGKDASTIPAPYKVKGWEPTTKDEVYRYGLMGKTAPVVATPATNAYSVLVKNEMHGPLCVNVFNAFKDDYTLGRTYSIFPNGKIAYEMDTMSEITLTIPVELQKAGRIFEMVCVSKDGKAYVWRDLDQNPNTITFKTDKFYAFGLCYKDL